MIDFFTTLKFLGFPVKEAFKEYNSIVNRGDIFSWQEMKRKEIVDFHLKNNAFYNNFIGHWDGSWDELPILAKADLQGNPVEKTPSSTLKNYYVSSTSGSSGNPFYFAKDKLTHALIWVNIAEHYKNAGISINDLQARFYGTPLNKTGRYKERIKDYLGHRVRFPVFELNDEVLIKWVSKFQSHSFKYLYGYTNPLVVFSRYLSSRDLVLKEICPTLKLCIVTSELCSDFDQQFIEKNFGVPVYNEYGASEVCVIGFGTAQEWAVSDQLVYLEAVDDNGDILPEGQPGRLLCTLLHNKATPIIRYDIGDVGSVSRRNGKTYLNQLCGRIVDLIVLPGGRKVPGTIFTYIARRVLANSDVMREYRVIYYGKGRFDIEIVADGEIGSKTTKLVKKAFNEYLEHDLEVNIKRVSAIERTGAGKFKYFLNLDPQN